MEFGQTIIFKVLIVGESGVGKTCMMQNYLGQPFSNDFPSTLGVDFGSKEHSLEKIASKELVEQYKDKTREESGGLFSSKQESFESQITGLKIQIWDSSGQERFHSIVTSYYRNCHGVIFACDLSRPRTLERLNHWMEDFNRHSKKPWSELGAVIVATKADLYNTCNALHETEVAEFAETKGLPYFIVSAKEDHSALKPPLYRNPQPVKYGEHWTRIPDVFQELACQMFGNYLEHGGEALFSSTFRVETSYSDRSSRHKHLSQCCIIL